MAGQPIGDKPIPAIEASMGTLIKLGCIARHADEFLSPSGHAADAHSIKALLEDPEVVEWMKRVDDLALLPVKRNG